MLANRLMGGFRLRNRQWYPWLFLILCICFLEVAYQIGGKTLKIEWVVSVLASAGGLTTFLYSQHLQETRFFAELFQAFNERYDHLNKRLDKIVRLSSSAISTDDQNVLMDYFNLCAEEHLYFSAGYIDPDIWRAWTIGMRCYADIPAIRDIWVRELAGGSYYGFSLAELTRQ